MHLSTLRVTFLALGYMLHHVPNLAYSGGFLSFGLQSISALENSSGISVPLDLEYQGSTGLAGLQFRVIASNSSIRFARVSPGARISDASVWALQYAVRPGKAGMGDTAIVLLYCRQRQSLPVGEYAALLNIFVDVTSVSDPTTQTTLKLADIVSALADGHGNSAGVGFGSQSMLNVILEKKTDTHLKQNYPNPFNPTTEIEFLVETSGRATVELYNVIGQKVATLFDDVVEAGQNYRVRLNASNLTSGMYFYRLESGGKYDSRRMSVLK